LNKNEQVEFLTFNTSSMQTLTIWMRVSLKYIHTKHVFRLILPYHIS